MTFRFDRLFGIRDGIPGALLSVIDVTSTQIRRLLITVFWDALPYILHVYRVCSNAEGNLFSGGNWNLTLRNEWGEARGG